MIIEMFVDLKNNRLAEINLYSEHTEQNKFSNNISNLFITMNIIRSSRLFE